jgi:hypothetical protein
MHPGREMYEAGVRVKLHFFFLGYEITITNENKAYKSKP